MEALGFLVYPFLACVLLILIHTYFGIHILERGIIFVDLCLAQFIGLGMALSLLMGYDAGDNYLFSFISAVLGASILTLSRPIAKVTNIEAFIGTLYVFSLSASILVLDRSPQGLEEFKAILNGNILWTDRWDLFHTFILYCLVGGVHIVLSKRFFDLSRSGRGGMAWEFLFFLGFAIVLVSSVRLAGILQVFSFLLIPALIGRLYTHEPLKILVVGWTIGILASLLGITVSYLSDLPTSPVIVLSLCLVFFTLLLLKGLWRHTPSIIRKR